MYITLRREARAAKGPHHSAPAEGQQQLKTTSDVEIGLASQRNPRGRIPQKCCGDCWRDRRGKSECRGECCGAVPGDLPRDCRGECRETALLCSSQERAVSRHSPRQSLGRSRHYPAALPPALRISPAVSPQHFWGIRPRGFLWLASPISNLM